LAGNHAFVGDGGSGLQVVDITDPADPAIIGSCDTPGSASDVAIAGDRAYVADSDGGLQVVVISVPGAPSILGSCPTPGDASAVAVLGDRAYVADSEGGLTVVDISDPAQPVVIESTGTTGWAGDVAVLGDFAYVADGEAGLEIVRILQRSLDAGRNTAQSLPLVETRDVILQARLVAAQDDSIAWALSADGGGHWTEVTPDSSWHDLTAHPGSDLVWRAVLTYTGGAEVPACSSLLIEWETATSGVDVADAPSRFALHGNAPNPFNPTTRIAFDLPEPSRVTLEVYSAGGRRVATLLDRPFEAGRHHVDWRGVDDAGRALPSGVYFARLAAGPKAAERAMVLLK
jgi:hypothetical protein